MSQLAETIGGLAVGIGAAFIAAKAVVAVVNNWGGAAWAEKRAALEAPRYRQAPTPEQRFEL